MDLAQLLCFPQVTVHLSVCVVTRRLASWGLAGQRVWVIPGLCNSCRSWGRCTLAWIGSLMYYPVVASHFVGISISGVSSSCCC